MILLNEQTRHTNYWTRLMAASASPATEIDFAAATLIQGSFYVQEPKNLWDIFSVARASMLKDSG